MKAIIAKPQQNAYNYSRDKELIHAYTVMGRVNGKLCEVLTARAYMGRSRSASTVYASIWVHVGDCPSGKGSAGGGGYHKESAAFGDAIKSAGIELYGSAYGEPDKYNWDEKRPYTPKERAAMKRADNKKRCHIGGVGDSAMRAAFEAIARASGARGKLTFSTEGCTMKTTLATLQKHGGKSIDAGFNTDSRGNKEPIFYYFGEQLPERYCDDISRHIRHTGWFCDDEQNDKARGIVVSLPAMPGFPDGRFLAGYIQEQNDERVIWPEIYSDEQDAAQTADSHAEIFADREREYQTNWQTARDIEYQIEDAFTRLRECLALRHLACMAYVRDEITELCETIRDKRETLKTQYADYV